MLAHPLHVPLSRAGRPALRRSMRLTAGARPCCMLLSSLVSSVRSTSACTGHDVFALVYEAYSGGSPLLHAFKCGRGLRHGNQRGWRCLWVTTLVLLCRPPRHGLRQRPFSAIALLSTMAGPAGHWTTRTIVSLNARQPHWGAGIEHVGTTGRFCGSMSTRQTQGALAGDPTVDVEADRGRPQQNHRFQSVKNPLHQDPRTMGSCCAARLDVSAWRSTCF